MIRTKDIVSALVGLNVAVVGGLLPAFAAPTGGVRPDVAAEAQARQSWREVIARNPAHADGCFHASYPSIAWESVACAAGPSRPYLPHRSARTRETTGDGTDFAAQVTGLISQSVGTFPSVTGVTKETDGSKNDYSIQLNSNFMTTAACNGISGCLAWEQFVYSSSEGIAFMQYWLINYGNRCPSGGGWMAYEGDCYKNSASVRVPRLAISALDTTKMSGTAVLDGNDTLVFSADGDAYSTNGKDTVTDLATDWTASEFNIIGDGGGSEATFNTGASVTVMLAVTDGSTAAPTCGTNEGTTAETNNLTLGSCKGVAGATPYIEFTESK
jgi:hypothetical protein